MAHSVQLSNASYALLRSLKRRGESFSDVVMRLASRTKDPSVLRKLSVDEDFDPEALREASRRIDLERLGAR